MGLIQPKKVVLNGDIIDIWQFKKNYWPKAHMKVIKHIHNSVNNRKYMIIVKTSKDLFDDLNKITKHFSPYKPWLENIGDHFTKGVDRIFNSPAVKS